MIVTALTSHGFYAPNAMWLARPWLRTRVEPECTQVVTYRPGGYLLVPEFEEYVGDVNMAFVYIGVQASEPEPTQPRAGDPAPFQSAGS